MIKDGLIEKLHELSEGERELALIVIKGIDDDKYTANIEDDLIDKIDQLIKDGRS